MMKNKIAVVFVCMGNICRSPTAEAVFRRHVQEAGLSDQIMIDSAGTLDFHTGKAPDLRAQHAAMRRGYDMKSLRARRVEEGDFHRFDYVLAMDLDNLANLQRLAPQGSETKAQLFLEYAHHHTEREVPDPYYGRMDGFERVLDMVEDASEGLLQHIRLKHFNV